MSGDSQARYDQQPQEPRQPPPPPPVRPTRVAPNSKAFRDLGVEDFFYDYRDPVVIERWLGKVIRTLQEMRAAGEDKVLLTLNLLQGTAYHWWLTQPASQQDPPEITWDEFLQAFRERFLPPSYHEDKMLDFLTIKQEWGSEDQESVADYTARFEQLLPYGGPIYQEPVAQRDHYLNGLRPQLYKSLCTVAWKDRWDAYNAAMNFERADQRILEQKGASRELGKRKVVGSREESPQTSRSKHKKARTSNQGYAYVTSRVLGI